MSFLPVALACCQVLRLARNRLQSLPEALGCYQALRLLDCSGNRLTSVPRVVGRCTALQQLLMASNRLRGLTSGIGNLVRLQVLDLSHNQYRHLPTMTGDLTQLQVGLNGCKVAAALRMLALAFSRRWIACLLCDVMPCLLMLVCCLLHRKRLVPLHMFLLSPVLPLPCGAACPCSACCWRTTSWRTCPAAAARWSNSRSLRSTATGCTCCRQPSAA